MELITRRWIWRALECMAVFLLGADTYFYLQFGSDYAMSYAAAVDYFIPLFASTVYALSSCAGAYRQRIEPGLRLQARYRKDMVLEKYGNPSYYDPNAMRRYLRDAEVEA